MPPKKGQSSKGAGGKNKSVLGLDEGSHIVFEDDNKKGKKGGNSKQNQAPPLESSGPPKPTAKQIIGGASWTGKLPVNLLSEHCQRQKWNKPDYSMRQAPGRDGHEKMYRSEVTLSKTDPKTREVITLPTFRTPKELVSVSEEPSALEARHFAAAYALFRISSMKNLSMALPPKYRDLWKGEFQQFKKEDEKEGRGWLYDADPFASEQKRKEIHVAMDKREAEKVKKAEAVAKNPSLALQQMPRSKQWENAPKIEMGAKIRTEVEKLVRNNGIWNPYGLKPSKQECEHIIKTLASKGFRRSHIEEALRYCKDEEEVLEWLLIHVPEDDLPGFALPGNYSAGVSLASGDMVLEAKVKRLAAAGYPRDFCAQALRMSEGHEHQAAFWLQSTLQPSTDGNLNDDIDSSIEWDSEQMTLESIYADRYSSSSKHESSISLELGKESSAAVRFIIPEKGYPYELPAILITSTKMPAYIRLSATKQALQFAETNFKGEPMVYNICGWLEDNLHSIIDSPMSLTELHMSEKPTTNDVAELATNPMGKLPMRSRRSKNDPRSNQDILLAWNDRQASPQQQKMLDGQRKLPAWQKQEEILQAIGSHRITIVTGETGSGKSTQVVQFVLDEAVQASRGSSANILCTQPRRVAALSLADRVSSERCSTVGEEVGYIIRGESRTSLTTKVTFMTTGVLLRRLQTSASMEEALEGISHIFIDEVHERSLDTDFLLALLKDSLKASPSVSIVLMSATLDKDIFMTYFGGPGKVAHVHIEGRTFPVSDHYLEEVLQITNFSGRSDDDDYSIGKTIASLGSGTNYDLITALVEWIDHELDSASGAILIFLPGTLEIDRTIRALSSIPNVLAYPLHASLLPAEQRKVFPPAPAGRRKVIAATNVAETSITIEDVVAVIDTGKVKETRYDTGNNVVHLEEVWASQAACKQRRGRAGRVRAGECYKLFTKNVEDKMAPKPLPEIQRVPLEQLCLSVKATGAERDVVTFLSALITPPEAGAVSIAINMLHLMGALEADQLTALGTYLSMIPADLRCAKLLVFGALFDCLEPCLTAASILTVKDPFVSPRDKRDEADAAKASFSTQHGDLMLSLSAYEEYATLSQELRYKQLQAWCGEKFLSLTTLRDITSTRSQLLDSLKDANLVPLSYRPAKESTKATSPLLLRALISAALQPQIAEIRFPEKKYLQSMSGAKELDLEARTIKYYLPPPTQPITSSNVIPTASSTSTPQSSRPQTPQSFSSNLSGTTLAGSSSSAIPKAASNNSTPTDKTWQRVFIHPSSPLFHSTPTSFTTGASSATYLSYFSKMATGAASTPSGPKTYIHRLTPLNAYTQLLFGSGGIQIDASIPGGGLLVGEHFKMRGWARIGVLVSRLRRLLDEELRKAVDQPAGARDFSKSEVVRVVKWLVELNGQDR